MVWDAFEEPGHFDDVLALYAVKYNLPVRESEKHI
jgi:hypothetical protein